MYKYNTALAPRCSVSRLKFATRHQFNPADRQIGCNEFVGPAGASCKGARALLAYCEVALATEVVRFWREDGFLLRQSRRGCAQPEQAARATLKLQQDRLGLLDGGNPKQSLTTNRIRFDTAAQLAYTPKGAEVGCTCNTIY